MTVEWYRDNTLLDTQTYNVDSAEYFCDNPVQAYNKIRIEIPNMQKPNRFLKIFNISDGITRQFYNDELENVEIIEQITNNNQALNINEASLQILPANTTGIQFQRTLPFTIYRDNVRFGKFFINTSTSNTKKTLYKLKVSDYIYILEHQTYLGGLYQEETVSSIISDILLGDVPYSLDATLGAYKLSGYLPIMNKREALKQVAFAINALVDTSRSDVINIVPFPTTSSKTLTDSEVVSVETTQKSIVTRIQLIVNQPYIPTGASIEEVFNEALNGTKTIYYSSPASVEQISGGYGIEGNCNYIVLEGTGGTVTLGVSYYEDLSTIYEKSNPYAVSTDEEKTQVYETTLACSDINLIDQLKFVEFYIKAKFKMGSIKVGDIVTLQDRLCRVISLSYDLKQSEIYCTAELEAYYG